MTSVAHPDRSFARSVTRLRLERGWSRQRLAEEAGIDAGSVYRVESGRGGCTFVNAWRIAEALEVSLDAMVRGEVP